MILRSVVVQDHIQQRAMDAQTAVVFDEAELAEFVHEKAHPRAGSADHFGQGFLADLGYHRLRLTLLPEVGQQQKKARQAFFARIAVDRQDLLRYECYGSADMR